MAHLHPGILGVLVPVLAAPLVAACSSQSSPGAADARADVSDALASGCDSTLTYDNFGMAFLATYCLTCHEYSQADIHDLAHFIYDAAVSGGDDSLMPPAGPRPALADRMKLGAWVNCGAP